MPGQPASDGRPAERPADQPPETGSGARGGDDRIWKVVAVAAGVVLVGFIVWVAVKPSRSTPVAFPVTPNPALAVGSTAPAFSLPRLGGGAPVSLDETRGMPTVVNFFASWCRDCQAELTAFARFSSATAGRVAVIGVDSNESDTTAAQTLLAKAGATYPVAEDRQATVATSYLLSALPVTYFLDTRGRVVHVAFGSQTLASLNHWADVLAPGTSSR